MQHVLNLLIYCAGDSLARTSALLESAPGSTVNEAASFTKLYGWLLGCVRDGSSLKTCPACCHPTEEKTWAPSSGRWGNWGMGGPTACLTLNGSESPRGAAASSLSDILETGDLPEKYFLSPKACAGILRRAEKRGRKLPLSLKQALEHAAQMTTKPKPDTS